MPGRRGRLSQYLRKKKSRRSDPAAEGVCVLRKTHPSLTDLPELANAPRSARLSISWRRDCDLRRDIIRQRCAILRKSQRFKLQYRVEGVRAVDGLPTWVRWIFVFAVGLSPILTFWMASVLWSYLRRTAALKKRLPWSQAPPKARVSVSGSIRSAKRS